MENTVQPQSVSSSTRRQVFDRFNLLIPILSIFAIVFTIAAIQNVYGTRVHAKTYGKSAIATLENYVTDTTQELSLLNQKLSGTCTQSDIHLLRQYVFHSPTAKEISLFHSDGSVYCSSNQGKIDKHISADESDNIKNNNALTSISFAKSSSNDKAISIYFANDDLSGIKMLLPPKQFLQLISSGLEEHYFDYQIRVLDHPLNQTEINRQTDVYAMQYQSSKYPLAISLQITPHSYLFHFGLQVWKVTFIACLLAFLYQAFRYYKITRNSLAFSLKEAINNQELELHFQPIVDINNHRIVGSEALIRWHNRDHGAIPPSVFIPLAEQMHVIEPITYQVFRLVTQFVEQNPHLVSNQYISINLSRTLIINSKFVAYLSKYAKSNAHILPRLLIEITEDNNFSSEELIIVREHLNHLKTLGFKIAMDDFGTGYSGLNFIHQHAFDTIKIDQVFIKGLTENSAIHSVLTSMIKLAKQLKMRVIVEGAETQEQVEQLRLMGIQYIQGFYYFRPLPAEDYLLKLSSQMEQPI